MSKMSQLHADKEQADRLTVLTIPGMSFTQIKLIKLVTMPLDALRHEAARVEQNITEAGVEGKSRNRRYIAVIDAIGEFRFPGEWNPWDKVTA